MKNNYLFLSLVTLFSSFNLVFSQTETFGNSQAICGTPVPEQEWENQFSSLVQLTKANMVAKKQQAVPYTIPVIIHVIHGGQAIGTYPNLAAGQLISQIQTLNNDYGGIGYNSSTYPLNAFVNYAFTQTISPISLDALNRIKIANCGVQFCLATKDTLGNTLAEPGIERINYVSKGWQNPGTINGLTTFQNYVNNTIKPQSIWNVSKYLNIWVTDENIASNSLLGYATFPPLSNLTGFASLSSYLGTNISDGFWCYAKAFGSSQLYPAGTYYQNYTFGRTSTHEIGHWLGMRHIWGDAICATDYCDDTPPAKDKNFNSIFNYPYHSGTCNGNSPDGEMVMNFMDYTNDNSKYMFTNDQAIRMQTAMQNSPYRKFLGTHNLCSVTEVASTSSFNIATSVCEGAALTLSNQSVGTPVPNFTWTSNGSPIFFPNNNSAITVTFPSSGIYTISLTSFNGTLSTLNKTVTVKPAPTLTLIPQRTNFCVGENIDLNLDGGSNYLWLPDSTVESYVFVPNDKPATFNYTCLATGSNACKTTTIINIKVIDCTGLTDSSLENNNYLIYPNPTEKNISIESDQQFIEGTQIELYEMLGKKLLSKIVSRNEQKNKISFELNDLNKGMYLLKINNQNHSPNCKILIKE